MKFFEELYINFYLIILLYIYLNKYNNFKNSLFDSLFKKHIDILIISEFISSSFSYIYGIIYQ